MCAENTLALLCFWEGLDIKNKKAERKNKKIQEAAARIAGSLQFTSGSSTPAGSKGFSGSSF